MRNVGLYQPSQLILSRNPWQKGGLAGAQSDKAAVALTESCCSRGSNESGPLKPWQLRPTHPFPLPHVIFLPDDLLRVDVLLPRLRPAHHFIAARGCISDYLWVAERGGSSVSWPNPRGQPRPLGPSFWGGDVEQKAVNGLKTSWLGSISLSEMLPLVITIHFK